MNGMAPVDPHDILGWAIVWIGVIMTAAAFFAAFRFSVWPGETEPNHPKLLVLDEQR